MRNQGVGSWISRRAAITPRRVALISGERSWTYGELAAEVSAAAAALTNLGVRWGDRVGYVGENHPAALVSAFSTGLLGAVFVPLSPRRERAELAAIVADAGCRLILYGPGAAEAIEALRRQGPDPGFLAAAEPLGVDASLADLIAAPHEEPPDLPVGLEDICFLLYTSGTSGASKGVILTHGNVTWNVLNFHSVTDFLTGDITLSIAPLYRAGGWGTTLLPTLHKGGTVVLPVAFDAAEALASIERHRVSTLFAGPELLQAMAASADWPAADLASLRWVMAGGDLVHASLIATYQSRGVRLLQGYGLAEAAPLCLVIDEADALRKAGSAGMPPLHTTVRVVREDMSDAPPGEIGELVVRGPNVMRGYWRRPEETDLALSGGWLHTGDAARRDEDGFFYIVDRMAHGVTSGGSRVFPAEVERVLMEHPGVSEAAVVVPREEAHGGLEAFVVVDGDASLAADQLMDWSRGRLPPQQTLTAIRIVASLPRNASGKVMRPALQGMVGASRGGTTESE